MFKFRLYSIVVLLALIALPSNVACARVHVDRTISFFLPNLYFYLEASQMKWAEIVRPPFDDSRVHFNVFVNHEVFPDLTVLFCSEANKHYYVNGQSADCEGVVKGNKLFEFSAKPYVAEPHYLVLDNSYSLFTPKEVLIETRITKMLSKQDQAKFERAFEDGMSELHDLYEFNEFDLDVVSCGEKNAFSQFYGGHITLCSELIFTSIINGNEGAFLGVFLHELGHSLLNLWDMPNWDNERTVDEFAAVMLILDGKDDLIKDWIVWFEQNENTVSEMYSIQAGGDHPATVQRIAALERILENKAEYARRWTNILYPRMTEKGLQDIINGSGENYHDPDFAAEVLEKRMRLTEFP